jgi:hypothetical protein
MHLPRGHNDVEDHFSRCDSGYGSFDKWLKLSDVFKAYCAPFLQAIADYGFKASPYPIILSFENHCSAPFQLKMANHLKNILHSRGLLWLPPESRWLVLYFNSDGIDYSSNDWCCASV